MVCLSDFQEGDEVVRLPCGHNFHDNCVRRWLWHHKQCPYRCSANVLPKREQWEARENFTDETTYGGENDMRSDIESEGLPHMEVDGERRGVNSPGRSTV